MHALWARLGVFIVLVVSGGALGAAGGGPTSANEWDYCIPSTDRLDADGSGGSSHETIIDLARSMRPAVDINGSTAHFVGENYKCKMHQGLVRFVVPRAMKIDFSLEEFSVGGTSLVSVASKDLTPAAYDASTVMWDRGGVVEFYERRNREIEQYFVVPSRPSTAGDLVMRGRIATTLTPPIDGTKARVLIFLKDGKPAVCIKDAIVNDAAGRTLAVDLSYDAGQLCLRVPAAWLADATYPLTVDPTIGSLISVDASSSGGTSENDSSLLFHVVDAAYSSTKDEYIVVWNEMFAAGSDTTTTAEDDYDVWFCRVNASTGAIVASSPGATNPGYIADTPVQEGPAQVAYNALRGEYLCAYHMLDNSAYPTLAATLGQILGTVITEAGAPVAPTMFVINDDQMTGLWDMDPDVTAIGSGGWLAVWQHTSGTASGAPISARIVASAGTTTGSSVLATDDTLVVEGRPAVSYNATTGEAVVVWDTGTVSTSTSKEVRACVASLTSGLSLGATVAVSAVDATESRFADIAENPTTSEWLVVWEEVVTAGSVGLPLSGDIAAQLYKTTSGSLTTVGSLVPLVGGPTIDGFPRVAHSTPTNSYIVTWHRLTWSSPTPPSTLTDSNMIASRFSDSLSALESSASVTTATTIEFFGAVATRATYPQNAIVGWEFVDTSVLPTDYVPKCILFDMPGGTPPPGGGGVPPPGGGGGTPAAGGGGGGGKTCGCSAGADVGHGMLWTLALVVFLMVLSSYRR